MDPPAGAGRPPGARLPRAASRPARPSPLVKIDASAISSPADGAGDSVALLRGLQQQGQLRLGATALGGTEAYTPPLEFSQALLGFQAGEGDTPQPLFNLLA